MSMQCLQNFGRLSASKLLQSCRLASSTGRNDSANPATETEKPVHASARVKRILERRNFRFAFPEFLPDPDPTYRNPLVEHLQRKDMLKRRQVVDIPEFYVGSVVSVTMSDPNAITESKTSTFNGIVIDRGGSGLRAWFIVRNVVDKQGIEIMYRTYSPNIVRIETLRLERRLDDELYYLRDADPKFSTFPIGMEPELLAEDEKVPLNDQTVHLRPKPWTRKWEMVDDLLEGYTYDLQPEVNPLHTKKYNIKDMRNNSGWQRKTRKYDLMLHYRQSIPIEEQDAIWEEVGDQLEARDREIKRAAIKRSLIKSEKKS